MGCTGELGREHWSPGLASPPRTGTFSRECGSHLKTSQYRHSPEPLCRAPPCSLRPKPHPAGHCSRPRYKPALRSHQARQQAKAPRVPVTGCLQSPLQLHSGKPASQASIAPAPSPHLNLEPPPHHPALGTKHTNRERGTNNFISMSILAPTAPEGAAAEKAGASPPFLPPHWAQPMPFWMGSSPRMTPQASQDWLLSPPTPPRPLLTGTDKWTGGGAVPSSRPQAGQRRKQKKSLVRAGTQPDIPPGQPGPPGLRLGQQLQGVGAGVLGRTTDQLPSQAGSSKLVKEL